ncbi:MAG: hypothetical protein EOO90_04210 [Pedobacter sp.]|nr:MAG: hypothetical protein EOO90_04210 [Pedobacter sp.]
MNEFKDIDSYIATFPASVQQHLNDIRAAISESAPEATEKISYGMPTFYLNGNLIHFAGYKNHIGLYATPSGHQMFKEELSKYKQGKGSVQFPLSEPMPLDLIKRITRFRVQEHLNKPKKK